MTTQEQEIWNELGIPAGDSGIRHVAVLDASTHPDWDWLATFDGYYEEDHEFDFRVHAVRRILTSAAGLLAEDPPAGRQPFRYAFAEVAFLRRFAQEQPADFARLCAAGDRLRIVGGGITSPDSLLSHPEAMLRNFLLGNAWLLSAFPADPGGGRAPLPPLRQVWVPDNFGHDPHFPVFVEAMGLQGAGFSRIPGDPTQFWTFPGPSGPESLAAAQLTADGVDFVWRAADGSTTLGHWMHQGYFQGQNIKGADALVQLESCIRANLPTSPTRYLYIPVANDFSMPVGSLPATAAAWNEERLADTGVYAVAATFDHYVRLVAGEADRLRTRGTGDGVLPFVPTPYWTGFYASRPILKALHQSATRALLAAEAFAAAARRLAGWTGADAAIAQAWDDLVPGTHHDYLPGTSAMDVYEKEQVPLSTQAAAGAAGALQRVMRRLAAGVAPSPDGREAAVFNPVGFSRGGLAVLPDAGWGTEPRSWSLPSGAGGPVQPGSDGGWIFSLPADALGAFGWERVALGTDPAAAAPAATLTRDGGRIVLANPHLSATLDPAADWGIASLRAADGGEVLAGAANVPRFYRDGKDLYQFGSEVGDMTPASATFTPGAVTVLEEGPVRVRVRVDGRFAVDGAGAPVPVAREYALCAHEPFVRMRTTLAAPYPYSVFTPVPLPRPAAELVHGTAALWTRQPAVPPFNDVRGGTPPIFAAAHDYVVPVDDAGAPLAAVLHTHVHAWAVDGRAGLLGCLARNPVGGAHKGMEGPGDPREQTVEYALRVPAGVRGPETGALLREAAALAMPLHALRAQAAQGALPSRFALATLSDPRAILTTAKEGTLPGHTDGALVLRVFQPTTVPLPLALTLAPGLGDGARARGVTALETPLEAAASAALQLRGAGPELSFVALRALTTLAVQP